MASFQKDNGKNGNDFVKHTSTGYEGFANHPANTHDGERSVVFFARHMVGRDGRPYTEIGINGLNDIEQQNVMSAMKDSLAKNGFKEASNIIEKEEADTFFEHQTVDPSSVALCVSAGHDDISCVVDAMDDSIIGTEVKNFIKTQEEIDDVLYQSIMSNMGEDMIRGPGGQQGAKIKAKELADYLVTGIQ